MKNKIQKITACGLLLPVVLFPRISTGCYTADFHRLQWLCSDYQMHVQGYVTEVWFQMLHVPGMERFLQEKLQITPGIHQTTQEDGSRLLTSMQKNEGIWKIELQFISKSSAQTMRYYSQWQQFVDRYTPKTPVGITAIAELPERLHYDTSVQIMRELAEGLELEIISEITTDQYIQISGYSPQLIHKMQINGAEINSSITMIPQEACTYLYIAFPVLYQQI